MLYTLSCLNNYKKTVAYFLSLLTFHSKTINFISIYKLWWVRCRIYLPCQVCIGLINQYLFIDKFVNHHSIHSSNARRHPQKLINYDRRQTYCINNLFDSLISFAYSVSSFSFGLTTKPHTLRHVAGEEYWFRKLWDQWWDKTRFRKKREKWKNNCNHLMCHQ